MPRSPQCLATSVTRAARVRFPPWASFSQTAGCVRRLLGQRVPAAGSPQQLGRSAQGPGSTPARAASPRASKKTQHRSRNWPFCSAFLLRLGGNTESGSESFQPSLLERFPLCRVPPGTATSTSWLPPPQPGLPAGLLLLLQVTQPRAARPGAFSLLPLPSTPQPGASGLCHRAEPPQARLPGRAPSARCHGLGLPPRREVPNF